jgi:tRNA threonylcarbamoyladenosine biosynthesis protein TsaB
VKLLALDTALAACSVALVEDDRVLAAQSVVMGRGQAEALMPMVRDCMAAARLDFAALDLLAVTVGPGSFTGLRTGIAAARGLALALGRPLVGVTTLEVLAHGAVPAEQGGCTILAAIDAHRGELYVQPFAADLSPLAPPSARAVADALGIAPAGPIHLVGSGAALAAAGDSARCTLSSRPPDPDVAVVARLALRRWRTGRSEAVAPLYLRAPDAKLPAA